VKLNFMLAPLCQGNNIASLRIKLKNIRATLSRVRGKKQAAKGPWAAAQQMQQQQRPNSQPLDRNSLQGPPADSSASLSAASMVGVDPRVMGAVQQQQRSHMDP